MRARSVGEIGVVCGSRISTSSSEGVPRIRIGPSHFRFVGCASSCAFKRESRSQPTTSEGVRFLVICGELAQVVARGKERTRGWKTRTSYSLGRDRIDQKEERAPRRRSSHDVPSVRPEWPRALVGASGFAPSLGLAAGRQGRGRQPGDGQSRVQGNSVS